jgi:hypothetical protein
VSWPVPQPNSGPLHRSHFEQTDLVGVGDHLDCGHRPKSPPEKQLAASSDHCYFLGDRATGEEVVPVNVSTWVLLFGVTVGR